MALLDAGGARLDEVMLPWMVGDDGRTVFEAYLERQLEITSGTD